MRDPKRIWPTLNKIAEIWQMHPDLRLGQLLIGITQKSDLFYLEDDELMENLEAYLKGE